MYDKSKTVIVYLAINSKKDETYGRDSRSMLEKSLDSLFENYNNNFNHDIIVFYDNKFPFLEKDQNDIKKNRNIKFNLLDGDLWKPPDCQELIKNPDQSKWNQPKFSLGYRNMMRWYGVLIYKYLNDLGYEWYMRMDDDSILHSKINYDLFEFMYNNNYEYGFRSYCNDHISVSDGLIEFCYNYCEKNNINPTFLNKYTLHNSKKTTKEYNILGYYNNFLITNLKFWLRDDVQLFLSNFDNTGYQYTKRWNDLISQAVTIQIFMERNKIYHFNDFTYEHTTFGGNFNNKQVIEWGGLYPDTTTINVEYTNKWYETYGFYYKNTFDTYKIEDCLEKNETDTLNVANIHLNNENFKPLNNDDLYYLGVYDEIDIMNTINDHWINCYTNIQRCIQFQYQSPYAFIWYKKSKKLYVINNKNILHKNADNANASISFIVKKNLFTQNIIKTTSKNTNTLPFSMKNIIYR
jgi:alpha 1,2-mannosyltransferase